MKKEKQKRTLTQNNALHKWFEMIADDMIEQGLTMTEVIQRMTSKGVEIYPTKENIKESIVKPIIKKMWGYDSTSELTSKDVDKLIDILNKFYGGMEVSLSAFPNRNNPLLGREELSK